MFAWKRNNKLALETSFLAKISIVTTETWFRTEIQLTLYNSICSPPLNAAQFSTDKDY